MHTQDNHVIIKQCYHGNITLLRGMIWLCMCVGVHVCVCVCVCAFMCVFVFVSTVCCRVCHTRLSPVPSPLPGRRHYQCDHREFWSLAPQASSPALLCLHLPSSLPLFLLLSVSLSFFLSLSLSSFLSFFLSFLLSFSF